MRPHTGWYAIPSHASSIKVCNSLSAIPFRTVILWVEKALGSKTPHLHNTREAKPTQRMHMMYMLCICRCSLHVQYVPQARQSTRRCCYSAVPTMSPVHLCDRIMLSRSLVNLWTSRILVKKSARLSSVPTLFKVQIPSSRSACTQA